MSERFYARSASDHTDDWPFWFVADRQAGGANRLRQAVEIAGYANTTKGGVLTTRGVAEFVAKKANEALRNG